MAQIKPGEPGDMAAFVRAVERGGFSAAAREMGLTPSALSKLVTRLEARLGVRLLNRSTRRLALTPEGEAYFQRSQRILADIEEAEAEVARFRARPSGLLRINTGTAFGMHQLVPALPEFLRRYPEIRVEVAINDRLVDLLQEGADLAVRIGVVGDLSLVAHRICDLQRTICAAPAYLARRGVPKAAEDLIRHDCLCMSDPASLRRWPFDTPEGVRTVEVSGPITVNNADAIRQLALAGAGIVRMSDSIVGADIARGALVPLLTDVHHGEPVPLYVVYPHGRHRSPKVAAMVDFLLEQFAGAPWRRAWGG